VRYRKPAFVALGLIVLVLLILAGYEVSRVPVVRALTGDSHGGHTDDTGGGPIGTTSDEFDWKEGSNFTMAEWWNTPLRAGCLYAVNPWPRASLAAQRAYVLAARQVLRDEWDINSWIAQNRPHTSEARIHGAETGCFQGHIDFPPHVHIFYLARDPDGTWRHINSHHYVDAQGFIRDDFIIPDLCGQNDSYHVAVDAWLNILDEKCTIVWQQRYTSAGDLELRRSPTAPIYALRIRSISGDLSSVDVLREGKVIATAAVVGYDPVGLRMLATIMDYQKQQLVSETWWGNRADKSNLAGHTIRVLPMAATPPDPINPSLAVPESGDSAAGGTSLAAPVAAAAGLEPAATITLTVAAAGDDGYQDGSTFTGNNKALWIGDNGDPASSYAGLRFTGAPLPAGTAVQSAILQLYSVAADATHLDVKVYGVAAGDGPAFSADNLPSHEPLTAASISLSKPPGWAARSWCSIDVTSIIREISSREDWEDGHALALIIKGVSGEQGFRRQVKGYADWDTTNVARLVIAFGSAGSPVAARQ
jgi:hypothetical protein